MRCCANLLRSLIWILLLAVSSAQAADISLRNPQISLTEDGYVISADFNINFNRRLEEAVNKGVVLYFAAEFELTKAPEFDHTVVNDRLDDAVEETCAILDAFISR